MEKKKRARRTTGELFQRAVDQVLRTTVGIPADDAARVLEVVGSLAERGLVRLDSDSAVFYADLENAAKDVLVEFGISPSSVPSSPSLRNLQRCLMHDGLRVPINPGEFVEVFASELARLWAIEKQTARSFPGAVGNPVQAREVPAPEATEADGDCGGLALESTGH